MLLKYILSILFIYYFGILIFTVETAAKILFFLILHTLGLYFLLGTVVSRRRMSPHCSQRPAAWRQAGASAKFGREQKMMLPALC